MSRIRARVKNQEELRARSSIVKNQEELRVRSSLAVGRLEDFTNIDSSILKNGSVLVYKEPAEKWTSTTILNQQTVDGGEF